MPYQARPPRVLAAADLPLPCGGPRHVAGNGHPRVFLPITSNGSIECPYCSRIYRLDGEADGHH